MITDEFESLSRETKQAITLAVEETWKVPPLTRMTVPGEEEFSAIGGVPTLMNSESGRLDLDRVDQMMATGQIAYPMALKKAPITTIVRSASGFSVESADERMAGLIHKNLQIVLSKRIEEMLTLLEYGAYYCEVIYKPGWPQDYALPRSVIPYWTIDDLNGCHPSTIDEILRDEKTRSFRGFVQIPPGRSYSDKVKIDTKRALVIPNGGTFGNLEGVSILKPIYAWWFWYELVWRAFLRFLQRQSTGVVLVKAPQSGRVLIGDRYIDNMQWALQTASSLHRTNYAAVPSDCDENGKELWVVDVKRMDHDSGGQYIAAINELMANIRNFLLTGSAEDSEGSEFEVMLDTERILAHVAMYFNEYVLPKYLMWNGSKSRVATLSFQGANSRILPLFFKLLAVAGNTAGGALRNVDWRSLMAKGGVPILSEEEVEELREQQIEEQAARFKSQWENKPDEDEKAKGQPDGEGRWASQRDKDGAKEKLEMIESMAMLREALNTPLLALTAPQVAMIEAAGLRADPGAIDLQNPYHDEEGRFTSKERAGRGGGLKEKAEEFVEKHAVPAEKRFETVGEFGGLVSESQLTRAKSIALPYLGQIGFAGSKVKAYGSHDDFARSVCGVAGGDLSACMQDRKHSYATTVDDVVYLSPTGIAYMAGFKGHGSALFLHELHHSRERSTGLFNLDHLKTARGIYATLDLEEGTSDLLGVRGAGSYEGPEWMGYPGQAGAIAIVLAELTGFDLGKAWQMVDSLHFNMCNWDFVAELFADYLGVSSSDLDEGDVYALIQTLMEKAAANNYAALGWLFTGEYVGEKERYR